MSSAPWDDPAQPAYRRGLKQGTAVKSSRGDPYKDITPAPGIEYDMADPFQKWVATKHPGSSIDHPEIHMRYADYLWNSKRDFDGAEAHYEEALIQQPGFEPARKVGAEPGGGPSVTDHR